MVKTVKAMGIRCSMVLVSAPENDFLGQKYDTHSPEMFYKNLYLHNVSELAASEGVPGLRLQKVPEEVRGALSEYGRTTLQFASNMEIRFVPLADKASFTLAAHGGKVKVEVWFGEFPSAHQFDLDETPLRINAAFCEKEMADYIAGRKGWDMAVLELSVNRVATFSVKDFTRESLLPGQYHIGKRS
jgi:hypothetical protein